MSLRETAVCVRVEASASDAELGFSAFYYVFTADERDSIADLTGERIGSVKAAFNVPIGDQTYKLLQFVKTTRTQPLHRTIEKSGAKFAQLTDNVVLRDIELLGVAAIAVAVGGPAARARHQEMSVCRIPHHSPQECWYA
jgi:hypothetical protein